MGFQELAAKFRKNGITVSNFVLLKVLERLRAKNIVKLVNGCNRLTGKKLVVKKKKAKKVRTIKKKTKN